MNQNLINSWSKPYSSNNIIDHPPKKIVEKEQYQTIPTQYTKC